MLVLPHENYYNKSTIRLALEREGNRMDFYIDDHAALYALLNRASEQVKGAEGREVSEQGVVLYGRERGARCALRCLADGQELTMKNYMLYGEWVDDRGWSKSELKSASPVYHTNTLSCGWCDSWEKQGLLDYGKSYCDWIDVNLVYGFNPALELTIGETLSSGGSCCDFRWNGFALNSEEEGADHRARRAELMPRVVRDFEYHCGHLLSALRRAYFHAFGAAAGKQIVDIALRDYAMQAGEEKARAVQQASEQDFLKV